MNSFKKQPHTYHTHVCTRCNTTWCHDPNEIPDDFIAAIQAHACPTCGKLEFSFDYETKKPMYCSNGARCLMLDGSAKTITPHQPIRKEVIEFIQETALEERAAA